MNRTPPVDVRRTLRSEIGFGCPVDNCGNPYLEWHHFDPPWHEKEHHNPEGMIALCAEHHKKADVGAFTKEQLKNFKIQAEENSKEIKGKFDWLRNKLLVVVGSCFFYETMTILQFRDEAAIWLRRDENGYLLLNLRMLTISGEKRLRLEDNFWMGKGTFTDFDCPPSGKKIHAKYDNGDEIKIEFIEMKSIEMLKKRYPEAYPERWGMEMLGIELPITVVEVLNKVGGTNIAFTPTWSTLPGGNQIRNFFSAYNGVGIYIP